MSFHNAEPDVLAPVHHPVGPEDDPVLQTATSFGAPVISGLLAAIVGDLFEIGIDPDPAPTTSVGRLKPKELGIRNRMPQDTDRDPSSLMTDTSDDSSPTPGEVTDTVTGLLSIADLLHKPKLARVFVYICYYGPTEPADVIDALDLPESTSYEYIDRLDEMDLIESTGGRPKRLTADPVIFVGEHDVAITSTLLHAVARQEVNDDIAYFVDKYGVERLAAALREAGRHYAGRLTQRMVADELAVQPVEAMAVVQALRPVLAAGRKYDQYFTQLFPEVAADIEFERDIDVTAPAPTTTDEPGSEDA